MTNDRPTTEFERHVAAALRARAWPHLRAVAQTDTIEEPAQLIETSVSPGRVRRHRRLMGGPALAGGVVTVTALAAGLLVLFNSGEPAPTLRSDSLHSRHAVQRPPTASSSPQDSPGGTLRSRPANLAEITRLADARIRAGDPSVHTGQYLLITTNAGPGEPMADGSTPKTGPEHVWRPADQHDLWVRESASAPVHVQGYCGDVFADSRSTSKQRACGRAGTYWDPSPNFVKSLPRDAAKLYSSSLRYMHTHEGPANTPALFENLYGLDVMLLTSNVASPQLSATLIRTLAHFPGLQAVDGAKTFRGRSGLGVQICPDPDDDNDCSGLIFDPSTGQVIGTYGGSPGTSAYDPSDIAYRVVDSAPVRH